MSTVTTTVTTTVNPDVCVKRRRYTPEERLRAINLSEEVGLIEAANQIGCSYKTLSTWRYKAGAKKFSYYSDGFKAGAVALANQIGIGPTAKIMGCCHTSINNWIKERCGDLAAAKIETKVEQKQLPAPETAMAPTASTVEAKQIVQAIPADSLSKVYPIVLVDAAGLKAVLESMQAGA